MKPGTVRFFAITLLASLSLAGCEGSVNDDSNFIVLTFRSSLDSAGAQANGPSERPVITPDGRFLVFESRATNLVTGDTNGRIDIFRKDLSTGAVVRVSVEDPSDPDFVADGDNVNANSTGPRMTPDGRFVVFECDASDVVPNDDLTTMDVFRRDLQTGETIRISVNTAGATSNGDSQNASISGDGRYVAFESDASNLVAADGNLVSDIFIRDTQENVTTRVSVSTTLQESADHCLNPDISNDGFIVVFESAASNLVTGDFNFVDPANPGTDIFARDWQSISPVTERVSVEGPGNIDGVTGDLANANGESTDARLSTDGRFVVFNSSAFDIAPNDSNGRIDVFIRDRSTGLNARASVSSQNTEGSQDCLGATISLDGRWVAFETSAPDLVGNDTNNANDIFLRDSVLGTTIRISVATYGVEAVPFFDSFNASLSGDGRMVAFNSSAPNLAPNDSNGTFDVFVRGPLY